MTCGSVPLCRGFRFSSPMRVRGSFGKVCTGVHTASGLRGCAQWGTRPADLQRRCGLPPKLPAGKNMTTSVESIYPSLQRWITAHMRTPHLVSSSAADHGLSGDLHDTPRTAGSRRENEPTNSYGRPPEEDRPRVLVLPYRDVPGPTGPSRTVPRHVYRACQTAPPGPSRTMPHPACRTSPGDTSPSHACRTSPCPALLDTPRQTAPGHACHAVPSQNQPHRNWTGPTMPSLPRPDEPSQTGPRRTMPCRTWPRPACHTVPCPATPGGDGTNHNVPCLPYPATPCRATPCLPSLAAPRTA